jgi:hypothetical protein
MSLLVLAGSADNGENHAIGELAELDRALSIDHTLPKSVASLERHQGVTVWEYFDDCAMEHERAAPIRSTSTRFMMSTWLAVFGEQCTGH